MRFGLPFRIALIFFLLTGVGVVAVTYISYLNASYLLQKQSLASLSNDLKRENALLEADLNTLKEEALFLSQLPSVAGIIRAHADGYDDQENLSDTSWRQRLSVVFKTVLEQRASYTQIRFIGMADNGRELARINRTETGVEIVKINHLQEKGAADYFQKSLNLKPGEVYYSRVNYNREHGKIAFPLQPVLRIGVPVFAPDGQIFGALVINVDFRRMATSLYQSRTQATYYLTNEHGDYIVHPDKDKRLAFELGEAVRIQDEYPIDINTIAEDRGVFESFNVPNLQVGMAAHRLYFDPINPERFFLISAVASHEIILNESFGLSQVLIYVAVIAVLLISVLAAVVSRLLTRRLISLREVADRVASGDENVDIAFAGQDEIGDLARSFKAMLFRLSKSRAELRDLTASLEHKVQERTQELESSNEELLEAKQIAEKSATQLEETLKQSENLRGEAEQAREDAEKYAEEARQASIAKSDFLANMSHELRTPLNGIIGMTHFTLESPLTSEQRQQLNTIDASAKALLALLNDILDVSKIEAGKLELEETNFDLQTLVDNTVEMHAINAYEKGIELMTFIDSEVPIALQGDPERLRQVMVNMLSNAIKFTDEGEVELQIKLEKCQPDSISLHFSVRDTGIGIPKEKQTTVFERFTQADTSTTRKYGGTGLGTTISRQIVELMNGRIWVESEAGEGTTFHFIVVLKTQLLATKKDLEFSSKLKNLKILMVVDNASQRRILSQMVTVWGVKVQAIDDGNDARRILCAAQAQGNPFDICLLEYRLPIKSGVEIAEEIRHEKILDELKIVLIKYPGEWVGKKFNDVGIDASVSKPIKKQALLFALLKAMGEEVDTIGDDDIVQLKPDTEIPPLNILVAEDNEVNQQVIKLALSKLNHQMTLAENGREAVEQWHQGNFDLILMDVQMPEMDGLTATKTIRSKETEHRHIPIIAATAHAMAKDREKCLKAGMDDYISKPINLEQLQQTIARVIKSNTATDNAEQPIESKVPATQGLYDLSSLRTLTQGDEKQLKNLIQIFVQNMEKNLTALQEAVANNNAEQVEFAAHKVKGSSGQLSAFSMSEIAYELEIMGKEIRLENAKEKLSALINIYQEVKPGLNAETQ